MPEASLFTMDSEPAVQAATGLVIAERYRLVDRIAGGGMGDVWSAVDDVLGRSVAIKFLRAEFADDDLFRERLRREARAAGSISHAGVVPVFDYGEVARDNAPYLAFIVMERVDGPSLSTVLSELGHLGTERTLLIIEQTALALQAAHDAGVVHRDIKPGNILVTPQGDVKITDFGISRAADSLPITRTGVMTGTAKYLSPEQAGGGAATASSDIYSLGVVAYACLAGEVPFAEGNEVTIAIAHLRERPPELPAVVPDGVRNLVMTMLAKDPADRPATAAAVAAAAKALLAGVDQTVEGHHPFSHVPLAVHNEQTQAIAAVDATRAVGPAEGTRIDLGTVAEPVQRGRFRRVAAVLLGLIVLAMIAGVWALSGGTHVPSVVGKQRAAAETILADSGLVSRVRIVDRAGKKSGVVLAQSAKADSEVDDGTAVTLTVASGQVALPVDKLLGASYADATSLLEKLGLSASKSSSVSSKTAGTVIAISPESRAAIGSTVKLTVAVAPAPPPTAGKGGDEKKDNSGSGKKGD